MLCVKPVLQVNIAGIDVPCSSRLAQELEANLKENQKYLNTYVTMTQITVTLYGTISYIRSPMHVSIVDTTVRNVTSAYQYHQYPKMIPSHLVCKESREVRFVSRHFLFGCGRGAWLDI